MVVWFVTFGGLGVFHVLSHPAVLAALSPFPGALFFAAHGARGFLVLGSVVLAVTGGEALYADMGHFGPRPTHQAVQLGFFPRVTITHTSREAEGQF